MSDNDETSCWLCDSRDIEPDDRGMRCRSCGATFNHILKPGQNPVTLHEDKALKELSSSPSSSITHEAARVRDNAVH